MNIKSIFQFLVIVTVTQGHSLLGSLGGHNPFFVNPITSVIQKLLFRLSTSSMLLSNNDSSNAKETPTSLNLDTSIPGIPLSVETMAISYTKEDWEYIKYLIINKRLKELSQYYDDHDIDRKDNNGLTGLHLAVTLRNDEMVKHFLEIGANPDIQDNNGNTPLHTASNLDDSKSMHTLLDGGASQNIKNKNGKTFLEIMLTKQDNLLVMLKNLYTPQGLIIAFVSGGSAALLLLFLLPKK